MGMGYDCTRTSYAAAAACRSLERLQRNRFKSGRVWIGWCSHVQRGELCMFTARTLLEGKWPILILAALTVMTGIWCPVPWAPILPLALLAFTISFFRDPEANVPPDLKLVVAPATGKIVEIKTIHEPHFLNGEATMVAIFLSVFDVHVQRAPIDGEVKFVQYNRGKFLDARNPDASLQNENRVIRSEEHTSNSSHRCISYAV